MKWYYMIRDDATRHGVAEEAALTEMSRLGQIGPDDLVWSGENGSAWVEASSVPGLIAVPEPAPVAAPAPAPVVAPPVEATPKGHGKMLVWLAAVLVVLALGVVIMMLHWSKTV